MNDTTANSILRNRAFALYLCARTCTFLASQMFGVAVGWQIYALTGSAMYLGFVGLVRFLPMFCLTLVVGYAADRFDRRLIARISQTIESLATGVLALLSFQGLQHEASILILVAFVGAARAFEGPALHALLPNLVPIKIFPKAAALSSSAIQTATIVGPAVGGFLYVTGATTVYIATCLLFFAASLFLAGIRMEITPVKQKPVTVQTLLAGINFIRSRKEILGAISLDLFAVLLGGATALLPIYARDILMVGPWGLGLLRSAPAVGALIVSTVLARRPILDQVGRRMFFAVLVFGVATIAFALSKLFLLSLAALFIMGASDVVSVVIRQSLVQIRTPDDMRGRVSAVNSMFIGTSNQLGEFESGVTAALFGTMPAAVLGGVGTILVGLLWMRLFPELRDIRKLDD